MQMVTFSMCFLRCSGIPNFCVKYVYTDSGKPRKSQGMNIFSSSQSLYKLPIPICGEIIELNKTGIVGSQPPSQHFLLMKWWLTLKSSHLWVLFLISVVNHLLSPLKGYKVPNKVDKQNRQYLLIFMGPV